jgi:hypothetical protein
LKTPETFPPYAIIRNRTILLNGTIVFSDTTGTLASFLENAYVSLKIDYPKFYKMDNLSRLGFLAAELLIGQSRILVEHPPESIALVLSNASASLDTDIRYETAAVNGPSPALFVYTLSNIVAGEICIRHKIKGENAFFITKNFDPALLTFYMDTLFAQGANACLAGWVEVLAEHHDVFLYLIEKEISPKYSPDQLQELYLNTPWNN